MGVRETLPVQDGLVLCMPLFTGSFCDECGHTTSVSKGHWVDNSGRRGWVSSATDSRITVDDAVDLRLKALTVFWWGDHNKQRATSRIICKGDAAGGVSYEVYLTGTGQIYISDGTNHALRNDTPLRHHSLTITAPPGGLPRLWLDAGYLGPFTVGLDFPIDDAPLRIGGHWTNGKQWDQPLSGVLLYNRILTQVEITAIHDWSLAQRTVYRGYPGGGIPGKTCFRDSIQTAPVTTVNQTSGLISTTPYRVKSGTWALREDAATGERYIQCIASGIIYRENKHAYGTWDLDISKGNGSPAIQFIASVPASRVDAEQSGYTLLVDNLEAIYIQESTAGAFENKLRSLDDYVDVLTKYTFRIIRSSANEFTAYVKGGVFDAWTLIDSSAGGTNPFTDATTTTSQYCVFSLDTGDRLYMDCQYADVRAV